MQLNNNLMRSVTLTHLKNTLWALPYLAVMGMIYGYLAASVIGLVIGLLFASVTSVIVGNTPKVARRQSQSVVIEMYNKPPVKIPPRRQPNINLSDPQNSRSRSRARRKQLG